MYLVVSTCKIPHRLTALWGKYIAMFVIHFQTHPLPHCER